MRNPARILADTRPSEHCYCQSLTDENYKAARARWAMDYTGLPTVESRLYGFSSFLASHQKWRIPKDRDYCQDFAELAICELKYPKEFSMKQPEGRDENLGRKPNNVLRAQFVDIEYSSWMNTWRSRYEIIYNVLEEDISKTFGLIWANQRG